MNVEEGSQFYFSTPGIRMGHGWTATKTANGTFNVILDFIDTEDLPNRRTQESHQQAMWEVNLVTQKVLYRNKYAKSFSWIPAQ